MTMRQATARRSLGYGHHAPLKDHVGLDAVQFEVEPRHAPLKAIKSLLLSMYFNLDEKNGNDGLLEKDHNK